MEDSTLCDIEEAKNSTAAYAPVDRSDCPLGPVWDMRGLSNISISSMGRTSLTFLSQGKAFSVGRNGKERFVL